MLKFHPIQKLKLLDVILKYNIYNSLTFLNGVLLSQINF
jgi:hypothetical protein